MNVYTECVSSTPEPCPAPDCASPDVSPCGTRPDGLPRWVCNECGVEFSDYRAPAEA